MTEIIRTIHDDDIRYVDDGERCFSPDNAVALMLRNGAVTIIGSTLDGVTLSAGGENFSDLTVNCSDIFSWGCTEYEDLPFKEIENLFQLWRKDPTWGTAIWCIIQRREMPQKPVEEAIRVEGVWDLDDLLHQHSLRSNSYDGMRAVEARRQYEVYSAWEAERGRRPRPFDDEWRWWEGWQEYVVEHPDWEDPAWRAEDARLCDDWLRENGFEPWRKSNLPGGPD